MVARPLRLALAAAALLAAPTAVRAADGDEDLVAGVAVGYSSHFERPFFGVDLLVRVHPNFNVVPNAAYADVGGSNRWTAGVELQWNAPSHRLHRKLMAWAGGGLHVVTDDPKGPLEATTRDLVANVVAGVGYDLPAAPFVQMRVSLGEPSDVGLSVGVRF